MNSLAHQMRGKRLLLSGLLQDTCLFFVIFARDSNNKILPVKMQNRVSKSRERENKKLILCGEKLSEILFIKHTNVIQITQTLNSKRIIRLMCPLCIKKKSCVYECACSLFIVYDICGRRRLEKLTICHGLK